MKAWSLMFLFLLLAGSTLAQDRIAALQEELERLSKKEIPGLKEKVDYSVSGVKLVEFLRALADIASLNMHIDESIEGRVHNNFEDEKALNILLFLCKTFDLDIEATGSILSIVQIREQPEKTKPGDRIKVSFFPYDRQIALECQKDTLWKVIREIILQSGITLVPSPGLGTDLVTAMIPKMPLEAALESFAYGNNYYLEKNRDGSFFLESKIPMDGDDSKIGTAQREIRGRNFNAGNPSRGNQNRFFLEVHQAEDGPLITAELDQTPIAQVLERLSEESGLNYIFFSLPQGDLTLQLEKVPHESFLEYLLKGTNFTYAARDGVYLIGDRNQEGLRSSELVQFRYRSVQDLLEVVPSELSREVEIKVFEELNGLMLSGSRPRIQEIQTFLKPLDRLVPLILIEVLAIDVRKGRDLETGIKAGVSDSITTGGSILPGLNFTLSSKSINALTEVIDTKGIINLGKVNPNFYATLSAMEQNNHIRIRSTPKLATLNGHEAKLTIGQTEYYLEQTQNIQGGNNLVTTITPQYREIQADLNIEIDPLVSADDHVTLEILAEFSSFTEPFVINGPPGKSTRKFESIIRVRNEEMIVLGGLEEQRKTKQSQGVPVLSRVPVLKWLFSSVSDGKDESKLLVFIKPTIVY